MATKLTDVQVEILNELLTYDPSRRNWDRGVSGTSKGFGTILNEAICELNEVDTEVAQLALELDQVGGSTTYVGEAQPGGETSDANWRIKRIIETGQDISIEWAGGNANFDKVWDDRLSLTYS